MKRLNKKGRELFKITILLVVSITWAILCDCGFWIQVISGVIEFSTIIWFISKSEIVIPNFIDGLEKDLEL